MTCSRCGKVHFQKHRWCRDCQNAYMRGARASGKWAHDSSEYKMVRVGKRVVREHLLVLEGHYGKVFLRHLGLLAHHRDGDPRNNALENLDLVTAREHYQKMRVWDVKQ